MFCQSPGLAQIDIQVTIHWMRKGFDPSDREKKKSGAAIKWQVGLYKRHLRSHFIFACFAESFVFAENRWCAKMNQLSLLKVWTTINRFYPSKAGKKQVGTWMITSDNYYWYWKGAKWTLAIANNCDMLPWKLLKFLSLACVEHAIIF